MTQVPGRAVSVPVPILYIFFYFFTQVPGRAESVLVHPPDPTHDGRRLEIEGRGLPFTRYCHYQYCIVHITMKGGRGNNRLRNSVGDTGGK